MSDPLWKGRFSKPPSRALAAFSSSIDFDKRLWKQDLKATLAHAGALAGAGILSAEEVQSIAGALDKAAKAFQEDSFDFNTADEDIHSAVERFLTAELGEVGAKIHAGRSRNDLVVTDLRLWLKVEIPRICWGILDLQTALTEQARRHESTLAPGYTHLQRAQPILLAHHLLAHAFALSRDFERMQRTFESTDVSCLGAAAFAGTTLPLDAVGAGRELGFSGLFDNSADAVSDRDFAIEFLSSSAILAVHLSRLGEEIVLWTSSEFGVASLDDAHATGSSIMPQKKNSDVAELARAKSARVTADLVHLLGVMKGLPLAYNRDLQEDKEPVFDAADSVSGAVTALAGAMRGLVFDKQRLAAAVQGGASGATDLAESLVLKGVPFRQAHEAIGRLAAKAEAEGKDLKDLTEVELREAHPLLDGSMIKMLEPRRSVEARTSHGGTAPERISEQLAGIEAKSRRHQKWLGEKAPD